MSKLKDAYDAYKAAVAAVRADQRAELATRVQPERDALAEAILEAKQYGSVDSIVAEFGIKNKNFIYEIIGKRTVADAPEDTAPVAKTSRKKYQLERKSATEYIVIYKGINWQLIIGPDGVEDIPEEWLDRDITSAEDFEILKQAVREVNNG